MDDKLIAWILTEYEKALKDGLAIGRRSERARITELAKKRICFDHHQTAACDHADCYALDDLVAQINEEGNTK